MTSTTTAVSSIHRIRPECTALALREFTRVRDLLSRLDEPDWTRPTDCPDWDVRAVTGHIVVMAQIFSSFGQFVSYMTTAGRTKESVSSSTR